MKSDFRIYATVGDLVKELKKYPEDTELELEIGEDLYSIVLNKLKSDMVEYSISSGKKGVRIQTGITDNDLHYDCRLECNEKILNIRTKLEKVFEETFEKGE